MNDKFLEESIEKMRTGALEDKIIPEKVYKLNMGDKQVSFTGAELLETNTAFLALFDAKKSGDEKKIKEAIELISKL
jgi:hypothetical protein